jgi:predicted ATPase
VEFLRYVLNNSRQESQLEISLRRKTPNGDRAEYELDARPYKLVRNQGRAWPLPAPVRFYGFPEEVSAYYQNAGFASDLSLELERQLKRILYLGPLRTRARRSYMWSGEIPDHVGYAGERAVEAILSASERELSSGFKCRKRRFQQVIADWLKEMGLVHEFAAKPIAANRKQYEVLVEAAGSREETTLMDVGFGVSQVLPVIVECFYPERNSTVVIEQPELHLHPRVQASLADLFIQAAHAHEGGKPRNMQFLIESHSEHFLYRLQRRIAEGVIKPSEVALYFCVPSQHGSRLMPLEIDDEGDILNWPEDFFGDEMNDLSARLAAVASSRGVSGHE